MSRCLELAKNGLGYTAPNPLVGSVIVYENKIIGEGFHAKHGEPHAEVNAINAVEDKSLFPKATLYVNLEPCSHFGKTPPCSDLIIKMGIKEVVIANVDSNPLVSGKGVKKLQQAGIIVRTGILEKESRELNKRFFTFHEKKRPYIILKWAETSDGFIDKIREASDMGSPTWITGEDMKPMVHKWRSEEQAILIGTNTAINDNPKLTTREWYGKSPIRIVIDRHNRLPAVLNVFSEEAQTIVFNEEKNIKEKNLNFVKIDFSQNIIPQLLDILFSIEIQSIIIEGGRMTLQSFIDMDLWDEARVFIGNKNFGNGIKSPELNITPASKLIFENEILLLYRNKK